MKKEWKRRELTILVLYLLAFYTFIILRSLQLSHDHQAKLYGLRPGWLLPPRLNDVSDAQWRNFRGNLPILTVVFGIFAALANFLRAFLCLKAKGMSIVWLFISLVYLSYLHGACTVFILAISSVNFLLVKRHLQRCDTCKSGKTCYQFLQERSGSNDNFSFIIYISYLVYAPLYIAGPIISFNAYVSQLDMPQNNYAARDVSLYGLRWIFSFLLLELLTHLFHYNAFAISGLWKLLSPVDIFIIGYGM